MTTIKGTICKGLGRASGCLALQIPYLIEDFPELASMRPSTINVELETPVHFAKFDCEKTFKWHPQVPPETFKIMRACFFPESGKVFSPVPCLLYYSSTSPHSVNPFMVEVITHPLDLNGVATCSLHIKQPSNRAVWVVFGA
jgi:hypothetical protein